MTEETRVPLLAMEGISKAFGAVQALTHVDLEVRPGEDEAALHERIKEVERPLLVETLARLIGENP